eukprot:2253842-Rhodomonas_salina.1
MVSKKAVGTSMPASFIILIISLSHDDTLDILLSGNDDCEQATSSSSIPSAEVSAMLWVSCKAMGDFCLVAIFYVLP